MRLEFFIAGGKSCCQERLFQVLYKNECVCVTLLSVVPTDIFLKSFPVHPKELKDKLVIINEEDGGLSDEHIASLRR